MARAKPVKVLDPINTKITVFGCGGTGGALLQTLCRLLYGLRQERKSNYPRIPRQYHYYQDEGSKNPDGVPGLIIVDGDRVEEKNLLRQPFVPADLHKKKALVLAERLGAAYGLDVAAYPHYVASEDDVEDLVEDGGIAVGCVDNTPTRKLIHDALIDYDNATYIDAGNDAVPNIAVDTREERVAAREGGWEGQVACGVRKNKKTILPFPGEAFPGLIEVTEDSEPLPTDIRCGDIVASLPQRHQTNLFAATVLMGHLTSLLTEGTVLNHISYFCARQSYIRSIPALDLIEEIAA